MIYYYPCQPNEMSPTSKEFLELENDPTWWAEPKKNGWRCMYYRDEKELWTRHKTRLPSDEFKELIDALSSLPRHTILDGELLDRRTKSIKKTYYLFDVLLFDGQDVTHTPYRDRRRIVEDIYGTYLAKFPFIIIPTPIVYGKLFFFHKVLKESENEGIVMKREDSKYLASTKKGLHNPYWIKVKRTS